MKGLTKAIYLDEDYPFCMYLEGDTETRGDIILTHSDVTGFVHLQDDTVVKAYLPKRVVNFKASCKEKIKVIVAVREYIQDHIPVRLPS